MEALSRLSAMNREMSLRGKLIEFAAFVRFFDYIAMI
jgi:hypothetical protein